MDECEFTNSWFDQHIPFWSQLCALSPTPFKRVLEIGSFEGRSSVWILENILRNGGELHCIDSWIGGQEHSNEDMKKVEARFDKNVALIAKKCSSTVVSKYKGDSKTLLAKMIAEGRGAYFDFIYVDGSHNASDVLADLILAFQLCRIGGLIVCDDYLWNLHANPLSCPKLGIDSFVNCYVDKLQLVSYAPLYQLYFLKTKE